ncbi:MAG TPA: hypothetical protein DCL61_03835 [Cyanobacteria bacterium UBA12227]|nr:hypothetical protein [Cyanobacteria bacterium UBA12227]HAX85690.1 hypothetical protein [Cyanobacteria bacterium UBA11370]HBY80930.1 hypothetical protein [Cyanobacteria bacterium UBA11148]
MGFLNWWQNNKPEEDSQLTIFGDLEELKQHKRVDGATVNNEFKDSIKNAGGSDKAFPRSIEAETQELFNCTTNELYEKTGAKKGKRSTLPIPAQEAYIVNETLSKHRLNHEVAEENKTRGSQRQKDDRIVETVRDTAENVRKWFPW